jgi:hypothetical protein
VATSPQAKALAFKSIDNGRNINAKNIHETTINHSIGNPPPEDTEVKELVVKTKLIIFGVLHEGCFSVLEVED